MPGTVRERKPGIWKAAGEDRDPRLYPQIPVGRNDQGGTGGAMRLPEREETLPSDKTGKPPCLRNGTDWRHRPEGAGKSKAMGEAGTNSPDLESVRDTG